MDYSWTRPNADCLFEQGKRFAVRYVGEDDTGENITKAEADRLISAGIKVVLVYQVGKQFMLTGGFDRGRFAAEVALWQGTVAGLPHDRPIYYSLDTNPNVLTDAQWQTAEEFLLGVHSVIGYDRTGIYGGRLAIDRLVPTFARWGWQTYAWSGYDPEVGGDSRLQPIWSDKACLRQYLNGQSLCGGTVDFDQSLANDFGQWPIRNGI